MAERETSPSWPLFVVGQQGREDSEGLLVWWMTLTESD